MSPASIADEPATKGGGEAAALPVRLAACRAQKLYRTVAPMVRGAPTEAVYAPLAVATTAGK